MQEGKSRRPPKGQKPGPGGDAIGSRPLRQLSAGLQRVGWPEGIVERMLQASQAMVLRPAQVLYRDGSSALRLFWLVEGFVKIFVCGAQGRRVLVDVAKPGALLGSTLVVSGRRLDLVEALTEVKVLSLSRADFQIISAELPPNVALELAGGSLELQARSLQRAVWLLTASLEAKVAMSLRDLAERFGIDHEDGRLLRVHLTHQELAELADVSRARLTKILGKLEGEGAVKRQGRRMILRPDRLLVIGRS